ncbi:hypothetical protein GP475_09630 [Corynebacterium poyangense]|uniref:4Fe-4S Wbl-type domain-containing protein n=1 Tax=Corynebacterium poyangense TaxID=2684405 RepID=A0A7H0SQP5_9CORY|nr:WhiB family transcriptional regulator [Corynebacterium poyangense]QNQ90870.1 hypothetical protein GP475_09630 [Corynebacterium poyangense]
MKLTDKRPNDNHAWLEHARCAGMDPKVFDMPGYARSRDTLLGPWLVAARVCAQCPACKECARDVLDRCPWPGTVRCLPLHHDSRSSRWILRTRRKSLKLIAEGQTTVQDELTRYVPPWGRTKLASVLDEPDSPVAALPGGVG